MILVASTAATEVVVVKFDEQSGEWRVLELDENSRIVLPVTRSNEDTFPLGLAVDTTSTKQIELGKNHSSDYYTVDHRVVTRLTA